LWAVDERERRGQKRVQKRKRKRKRTRKRKRKRKRKKRTLKWSDGTDRVVVVGEDPPGRRQHGNAAVLKLGLAKPEG
jgi:hypothetical protein